MKKRMLIIGLLGIALMVLSIRALVFTPRYEPFDATQVESVAMGRHHTLFIMNDGSLWGVGSNEQGQLGLKRGSNLLNQKAFDGTRYTVRPVRIMDGVKQVAAGTTYSLVLKQDGTAWFMGDQSSIWRADEPANQGAPGIGNLHGTVPTLPTQIMDNVEQIASGRQHLLLLKGDGSLWGVGMNDSGQLGVEPDPVLPLFPVTEPVQVSDGVKRAFAGPNTTFYITTGDELYSCGASLYGELGYPDQGLGDLTMHRSLNYPPRLVQSSIQAVYPGLFQTLLLDQQGTLWHTGLTDASSAQAKPEVNQRPVAIAENVLLAAAGGHDASPGPTLFELMLRADGSLWAKGNNLHGQLGAGADHLAEWTKVMEEVSNVWTEGNKVIIQTKDGQLHFQGQETYGELLGGDK